MPGFFSTFQVAPGPGRSHSRIPHSLALRVQRQNRIFSCWNEATTFILYSMQFWETLGRTLKEKRNTQLKVGVFLTQWVESSHPHTILSRKCHFLFQETKVWRILSISCVLWIKGDNVWQKEKLWSLGRELVLQHIEVKQSASFHPTWHRPRIQSLVFVLKTLLRPK